MKYTAILDGEYLEIELTRSGPRTIEASVGGERYVVEALAVEPGVLWFQWNNRSIEILLNSNGETYGVSVSGHRLKAEIIDSRNALRRSAHQGHTGAVELRAPMPGKVVKILVEEGAAVELNQGLLVIEAMKMQNEIKSPKQGIVRKISVKDAGAVNAGDLLLIVE